MAMFSKVQELMLKRQRVVRKMSSCWGKQRLMNTISDSSCTSSIVLYRKYFMPFTKTEKADSMRVVMMKARMRPLFRVLKEEEGWQTPELSSSALLLQQHMPQMGAPLLPRLGPQAVQVQQCSEVQVRQLQWQTCPTDNPTSNMNMSNFIIHINPIPNHLSDMQGRSI